jgi:hypothetical protein
VDLVVDLEEAVLPVLAHVEAHGDDRTAAPRDRVDVLDPIDLGQQLLEPGSDLPLHLPRIEPRRFDVHVCHRHDDLGLLFPGREEQRDPAEQQRGEAQQDREVAAQEEVDDAAEDGVGLARLRIGRHGGLASRLRLAPEGLGAGAVERALYRAH